MRLLPQVRFGMLVGYMLLHLHKDGGANRKFEAHERRYKGKCSLPCRQKPGHDPNDVGTHPTEDRDIDCLDLKWLPSKSGRR